MTAKPSKLLLTSRQPRNRSSRPAGVRRELDFGTLEPRTMLATVTVGNLTDVTNAPDTSSVAALVANDGGDGISLREALAATNSNADADVINFDASLTDGTLVLTQGQLTIEADVSIDGDTSGSDERPNITLTTSVFERILLVSSSVNDVRAKLDSLNITGGSTYFSGGGIYIEANTDVTITNSTITDNRVDGQYEARGGAIYNDGTLTLRNTAISNNSARAYNYFNYDGGSQGGEPYSGNYYGGRAYGGAIYNNGTVTMTNTTLHQNYTSAGGYVMTGYDAENNRTGYGLEGYSNGGGIYNLGTLTLANSTLSGNYSDSNYGGGYSSGGIANYGNTTLINTIALQGGYTDLIGGTAFIDGGGNVTNTIPSVVFESLTNGNGTLADNGGPVPTIALAADVNNPALDVGVLIEESVLAIDLNGDGDMSDPVDTDARLFVRPFDQPGLNNGGPVDAGAYELATPLGEGIIPQIVSVVVDDGPVQARPDLWSEVTFVFNTDVSVGLFDISLVNNSPGGGPVDLSGLVLRYVPSTFTATWNFDGLAEPLPAGFYTYRLDASSITNGNSTLDGDGNGVGGDDFVGDHYVAIPGDLNLDGQVDVFGDGFAFLGSIGTTSGAVWADGDFNADGQVDIFSDGFTLLGNLGRDVRPIVTTLATASSSPSGNQDADGRRDRNLNGQMATSKETPQLTLAGDQDLRDDLFAADF